MKNYELYIYMKIEKNVIVMTQIFDIEVETR